MQSGEKPRRCTRAYILLVGIESIRVWCADIDTQRGGRRGAWRRTRTNSGCLSVSARASRAYAREQGLRVTNWHYPREPRQRTRCSPRGISREVSPSASSIPDAILRNVKVSNRESGQFRDRQFASEGNNYEQVSHTIVRPNSRFLPIR